MTAFIADDSFGRAEVATSLLSVRVFDAEVAAFVLPAGNPPMPLPDHVAISGASD